MESVQVVDWAAIVGDLLKVGQRQVDIARGVGLQPPSIPDIVLGRQKSVKWEVGQQLLQMHKIHCSELAISTTRD